MSESYKRYPFEYDIPPVAPPNTFHIWHLPDGTSLTPEQYLDTVNFTSAGGSIAITGTEATDTINLEVSPTGIGVSSLDQAYIAAEPITIRDVVYISATGQIGRAINTGYSTSKVVGLALASGGTLTSVLVRRMGRVSGFTGLTIGNAYFLDASSGQVTNVVPVASGAYLIRIGFAVSTSEIDLDIATVAARA